MDSRPPEPPHDHPTSVDAPPRKPRRWLGALVALLGLAGVIGGAWYLVNRPPAERARPARGGPGGPGGQRPPGAAARGPGGGGNGPLVTVGQALARQASCR